MTVNEILYSFYSGFGMPAYAETAVPADAHLPFLTYENSTGMFNKGEIPVTVNIWMRTESEATINAKAAQIAEAIGRGGKMLSFDNGAVWIKCGSPFSQAVNVDADTSIKRRYINLNLEFIT